MEKFKKALWRKPSRCGSVYSESEQKRFFIERLKPSIKYSVRRWCASKKEADMSELAQHADHFSSLLGDPKPPKVTESGQGRHGRGKRPERKDLMQVETKRNEGYSSYQGVSLSSEAAEFIEELMDIHSNMSSSSKGGNRTDLDSTTSMDSGNRCRICHEEGYLTSACNMIINKD